MARVLSGAPFADASKHCVVGRCRRWYGLQHVLVFDDFVDSTGATIDFLLSETRDRAAGSDQPYAGSARAVSHRHFSERGFVDPGGSLSADHLAHRGCLLLQPLLHRLSRAVPTAVLARAF